MIFDRKFPVRCARCGCTVPYVEWSFDFSEDAYEVRVRCHGESECCFVPRSALQHGDAVVDITAFRPKLEQTS